MPGPFIVSKQGFPYLCVNITPSINGIVAANSNPLTYSVTQLINRRTKLPISLIGWNKNDSLTEIPTYFN